VTAAAQATPGVDVVYVNHDSSRWTLQSVASLLAVAADGFALRSIVVVDNDSAPAEAAMLRALPARVQVVHAPNNAGFAAGCNLGARAGSAELVLFINPDTRVLADTLPPLVAAWRAALGRAVVGPRQFLDDACTLAFAPLSGTSLWASLQHAAWDRGLAPGLSLRLLRRRVAMWDRGIPVAARALSGGALLIGRELYAELDGFDERFFLYAEDTDLCVRASRAGAAVRYVPGARIVHYGDQSSRRAVERAGAAAAASEAAFLRKHHGPLARSLAAAAQAVVRRLPVRQHRWQRAVPAALDHEFLRPGGCRWVVELARSPLFDLGVTVFPDGGAYRLPADLWARLRPGGYYARVAEEAEEARWRERGLYRLEWRGVGTA
jgi:GT2 family glycosyltransferase